MTDINPSSDAAKALGALGASKGGKARAMSLTAEQRSEAARAAVEARWQKAGKSPLPRATHKGSFKEDFGIDVDCYVLNDEARTAVISQRGMGEALGLGKSGSRLPRFVEGKAISTFVGPELREKVEQPVIFQAQVGGPETLTQVHGYDVTILIDLCKAITKAEAEGKLFPHQANVARQAHVILNASAKAGIKGLVYALSGYDATREETIAAFKLFVQDEAREYEKEFPDLLYSEWYRLYDLPKPERNKPWKFKHLTVDQVYRPLARSNGKILQLTREKRESAKSRWKRLHEFLSEIGVKALRTHLGQLLGIARISRTKEQYEKHVRTLFGDQYDLDLKGDGE